jgi:hypothetical protein
MEGGGAFKSTRTLMSAEGTRHQMHLEEVDGGISIRFSNRLIDSTLVGMSHIIPQAVMSVFPRSNKGCWIAQWRWDLWHSCKRNNSNLNQFTYNISRGAYMNNTWYSSWEMVTHNNQPLFGVIGKFSLSFLNNKCCYCDVLNIFLSCNREPNAIESSTSPPPPIRSKGT